MGNRTLRFLLATVVSLALAACTQAENQTTKGVSADRVGNGALQVSVTAPKIGTAAPTAVSPALTGRALYAMGDDLNTWDDYYAPVDAAEFRVNKATVGAQYDVDISCNRAAKVIEYDDGDGVWQQGEYEVRGACVAAYTYEGATFDVFVRKLQNSQYALDAKPERDAYVSENDVLVTATDVGSQSAAKVAYTPNNPNGGFVVVWTESVGGTVGEEIRAQRFDKTATRVGDTIVVNTFTTGSQQSPDVAIDNSGNFVVAWQSQNQTGENDFGIFARRFDSDGNPSTPAEFMVNLSTTGKQTQPAIAMQPVDGWYVIGWQSIHAGAADIYASKFTSDGTRLGAKLADDCVACAGTCIAGACWDTTAELQVTSISGAQTVPDVGIAETGGNVVFAYDDGQNGAADHDIGFRVFDSSFVAVTAATRANIRTAGNQIAPAVTVNPDGTFVVAWSGPDTNGNGVFYHRFAADGVFVKDADSDDDVLVNKVAANEQVDVSIATVRVESAQWSLQAPTPSFIVAFEDAAQDGNNFGIMARRFAGDDDSDQRGWDGDNCKVDGTGTASNVSQADADNDLLGDSCDNCRDAVESCTKFGQKTGGTVSSVNFCTMAGTTLLPAKLASTTENNP